MSDSEERCPPLESAIRRGQTYRDETDGVRCISVNDVFIDAAGVSRIRWTVYQDGDIDERTVTRERALEVLSSCELVAGDGFPVHVNGHCVVKTAPKFTGFTGGMLDIDPNTAFRCENCEHVMHPPQNRVEDERWVSNAFDCVDCNSD